MFSTEPSFAGLSEYADILTNQTAKESYSRIYVEFEVKGGQRRGQLFPYEITLNATEGEPLNVEVIAFVCQDWPGLTYLGYTGVLDRIQWAIHPGINGFFFGPLHS